LLSSLGTKLSRRSWWVHCCLPILFLGSPIIAKLGVNRLEPVTVTIGATVLSDTLSLVVFAICVSTYKSGFSISALGLRLLIEIGFIVPLILLGLSHLGGFALKKVENDESSYFVLMFGIMAVAGALQVIDLPGIVGAFLAGLSVNAAVHDKPAKEKLEFVGNSLFVPIFFIVTGFLIDPVVFARSIIDNFSLVSGIITALVVGKWIAASIASRAFNYGPAARLTMWSLTLPQVVAAALISMLGILAMSLMVFRQ
jgi:Kef-type K+ transport system membrane component KefB